MRQPAVAVFGADTELLRRLGLRKVVQNLLGNVTQHQTADDFTDIFLILQLGHGRSPKQAADSTRDPLPFGANVPDAAFIGQSQTDSHQS